MTKQTSVDPNKLGVVVATDCGSTTTKAIMFEKTADGWRSTSRGEAPTTVEKPVADVTIGAQNAFNELQEISGRKILQDSANGDSSPFIYRSNPEDTQGIDLYVSTSSAGGGLQMIVAGAVSSMTTESAERAALGAGAIVMDAISIDDGREQYERVSKIRHLRPDIILLSGGVDGGNVSLPLELAETILQADPRPRFGETLRLPVIYAGNSAIRDQAAEILASHFEFVPVTNVRPELERENLAPARDAIHELFLHHVMSHAPGYKKLLGWTPIPIEPTPAAFGYMVQTAAEEENMQIVAVDIGGATTDVFSVFKSHSNDESVFNRTVSANLGMSYSVANVLLEAGEAAVRRWLPFEISADEMRDRLRNKMIRPTSIPQTMEDLILEQAVCREALRLAFIHHKRLAVGLRGTQQRRTIAEAFSQSGQAQSLIDMRSLDLIIGSGGVLSHAPDRRSTAFMLLDSYEPIGVTRLAVDSIFMMPHLGVFSRIHPSAANQVFFRDCLIDLGTVIAPDISLKPGAKLLQVKLKDQTIVLKQGELLVHPLGEGEVLEVEIVPLHRRIDIGGGPGREIVRKVVGGKAGLILDGRGRPLDLSPDNSQNTRTVRSWYEIFGIGI
ncbi:MAG: glutamate mutase L [Bdellovibrionales bacterium]|nr:glutamate mutase L [Bdellovibrionales bacterium]